jgi:hypothetical protein
VKSIGIDCPPDAVLSEQYCSHGRQLVLISDFQNFLLTPNPNQHYSDLVPLLRGALRNVTDAERDAVDAAARLTGEPDADGKIVWSWRPDAGVKVAERSANDGGKRARTPGRART